MKPLVFVPQKLREARLRKFPEPEWSLRRVARDFHGIIGVTPQTLSEYELGTSRPTPDKLLNLCALYGVELSELAEIAA